MAQVEFLERIPEPAVIPDAAIAGVRELPIEPGDHLWAVGVFYRVKPADSVEPRKQHILDGENMLTITAIHCFNCGVPHTDTFARMECPNNV